MTRGIRRQKKQQASRSGHAYAVPDSTIAPDRNRTRPDPKCRRHRLDITREVKGGLLMRIGACLESVREATGEGGEYRLGVTLAELGTRLIAKRLENHDRQM